MSRTRRFTQRYILVSRGGPAVVRMDLYARDIGSIPKQVSMWFFKSYF